MLSATGVTSLSQNDMKLPANTFFVWSVFLNAAMLGIIVTFSGVKLFLPWDQVTEMHSFNIHPFLLAGHPHFYRYLVTYPGFLLDNIFSAETGFSIYVSFFFALNAYLWARVYIRIHHTPPPLALLLIFIAIHFSMNGRGVFAWTAWLLAMEVCISIHEKRFKPIRGLLIVFFSLWLASVSTGVFIVVFSIMTLFTLRCIQFRNAFRNFSWIHAVALATALVLIYAASQYFVSAIIKNVDYYGGGWGGVISMLDHGLGRYTFNPVVIVLVFNIIIVFSIVFLFILKNRNLDTPVTYFIAAPLMGGLFGITVLTLVIPALLLRGVKTPDFIKTGLRSTGVNI